MLKIEKYRKYLVLLGGFLLHLTIGNLYTYNNISPFLINYMQNNSLSKGNVYKTNAVWILSLSVFGLGSSVTLGGILEKKIGPSLTVLLGGWFMSLNVMLMSFTITTYLSVVILSYGLCTGIGSGIVYGVSIGTAFEWFPKRRGIVCGIVVSGFGLSSFLFDILQSRLINRLEEYRGIEWIRISYIIMGACYIFIQYIGALLIFSPTKPDIINENKNNSEFETILSDFGYDNDIIDLKIQPHQLHLELDFWLMWITYALLSGCFTLIVSITKDFGIYVGIEDIKPYYVLSSISIIGSLSSAVGRIIWGYFIDKYSYKNVMIILTISLTIFFGTFYIVKPIHDNVYIQSDNMGTITYYIIWIIFLYFIPSGIFSIFPKTCSCLFGLKYFVANYGMLFTAYSFGGLLTGIIITFTDHSYWGICIAGSLMSFLAALITLIYRGKSLIHRNIEICH